MVEVIMWEQFIPNFQLKSEVEPQRELWVCPYDVSHKILPTRMLKHLAKCRKNHMAVPEASIVEVLAPGKAQVVAVLASNMLPPSPIILLPSEIQPSTLDNVTQEARKKVTFQNFPRATMSQKRVYQQRQRNRRHELMLQFNETLDAEYVNVMTACSKQIKKNSDQERLASLKSKLELKQAGAREQVEFTDDENETQESEFTDDENETQESEFSDRFEDLELYMTPNTSSKKKHTKPLSEYEEWLYKRRKEVLRRPFTLPEDNLDGMTRRMYEAKQKESSNVFNSDVARNMREQTKKNLDELIHNIHQAAIEDEMTKLEKSTQLPRTGKKAKNTDQHKINTQHPSIDFKKNIASPKLSAQDRLENLKKTLVQSVTKNEEKYVPYAPKYIRNTP